TVSTSPGLRPGIAGRAGSSGTAGPPRFRRPGRARHRSGPPRQLTRPWRRGWFPRHRTVNRDDAAGHFVQPERAPLGVLVLVPVLLDDAEPASGVERLHDGGVVRRPPPAVDTRGRVEAVELDDVTRPDVPEGADVSVTALPTLLEDDGAPDVV